MVDTLQSAQGSAITTTHSDENTKIAERGDHFIVFRPLVRPIGYYHHGVYVGNGEVIHYAGETAESAVIRRDSVAAFADGGEVRIICHEDGKCYPPEKVVENAEWYRDSKRFEKKAYNFFLNNCEHFARWCKTGIAECKQTQRIFTTVAGGVVGRQIVKLVIVRLLGFATGPLGWILTAASIIGGFAAKTETGKKAIFKEDGQ